MTEFAPTPEAVANALAATRYAVAAAFNSTSSTPATKPVPDDFDWPALEDFIHHLGIAADDSEAALNLYRLLMAVQRIAYREGAGRNSPFPATRLNSRTQRLGG
ncbi:hypothetical protein ACPC54_11155 [Kitasatospora sp. NPDC094028]